MNIEERVEEQIRWNSKKSSINKRFFYICSCIIIFGSILASLFVKSCPNTAISLSTIVAITTSLNNLFKFSNKWKLYRCTTELLKRERSLFENEVDNYKGRPYDLYTKAIENIIRNSNTNWTVTISDKHN